MKGKKKAFNTTIDEDVSSKFKETCEQKNIKMNLVLEKFMLSVVDGSVLIENEITIKNNKSEGN